MIKGKNEDRCVLGHIMVLWLSTIFSLVHTISPYQLQIFYTRTYGILMRTYLGSCGCYRVKVKSTTRLAWDGSLTLQLLF